MGGASVVCVSVSVCVCVGCACGEVLVLDLNQSSTQGIRRWPCLFVCCVYVTVTVYMKVCASVCVCVRNIFHCMIVHDWFQFCY